jgi:hypothetical protein
MSTNNLILDNPDITKAEQSYLTVDYASGVTLTLRNNDGFTSNWFAVVGEPGQEQTEGKGISSSTGNTVITLAGALKFSHPKSCPVYLSQWDKVSVERKLTGAYSTISGSPFDLEWDDEDSTTTIPGIDSTYTYRWRFYNSLTASYSDYSGEILGSGLSRNQAGYVIQKIRLNPIADGVGDETLYQYMNDYQDLVYENIPKAWWFKKEGTEVATAVDTYKYSISTYWSDLESVDQVLYRYVSGDTDNLYILKFATLAEFYNLKCDTNQTSFDGATKWSFLPPDANSNLGYIGIHPTAATVTCYLKPIYYRKLPDISGFSDTLYIPNTKGYEDYALYRIYDDIKSDQTNATKYSTRVGASIIALKRRTRRQLGQNELFRYRGQRGWNNMFGNATYSDSLRERYW